jgi:VWFA-related protein
MCTSSRLCLAFALNLLSLVCVQQANAQAGVAARSETKTAPASRLERPTQGSLDTSDTMVGLIKLDILVTDNSGKSISGLEPKDFTLLDNGQLSKVLSFQEFDGGAANPDPPVEVILLIDALQLPSDLILYERASVETFLRQNGGHLAQPVSILSLVETGLWQVAEASSDGNALAEQVAHNSEVRLIRPFQRSTPGEIPRPTNFDHPPSQDALQALGEIATAERRKPGRKLLLWVGPGWGMGSGAYAEGTGSRSRTFYTICWFSALLREARIALYSFSIRETDQHSDFYLGYLHGVESVQKASFMNLYRKVLAVQSGGRVLDSSHDLVREIDSCVNEAAPFYRLSFNPSHADHPDEYHELNVRVGKPGLTARTNTGYYDEPYYSDQPETGIRRVTVEQLEQALDAVHGDGDADAARQLSALELTERLSGTRLASLTAAIHGQKTRQALTTLADESTFLLPPPADIPADAPPDATAQLRMIASAADYLKQTISKLPNFFAIRTTVRYEEAAQLVGGSTRVDYEPLHVAKSFRETVLYRRGYEVADSGAKRKTREAKDPYLVIYGTFGPVLGYARDAIAVPSALTWSRWERGPSGLRAVFRYVVPGEKSVYPIRGCCLPGGNGTNSFEVLSGYHGEIAIDPSSGAILHLEAEADLEGFTPVIRSGIMVAYGPVEIGGKTFICPVRSVSIMRMRSVTTLTEWDESFRTYGPYLTMLNDISYQDYHMFRGDSRMMPGFNPTPGENSSDPSPAHPPVAVAPSPEP